MKTVNKMVVFGKAQSLWTMYDIGSPLLNTKPNNLFQITVLFLFNVYFPAKMFYNLGFICINKQFVAI